MGTSKIAKTLKTYQTAMFECFFLGTVPTK